MQFQRIGEAYNAIQKHLDKGSRPSRGGSGRPPFGYSYSEDDNDEYYDDEDDYYDDYDDSMDFYMCVL